MGGVWAGNLKKPNLQLFQKFSNLTSEKNPQKMIETNFDFPVQVNTHE